MSIKIHGICISANKQDEYNKIHDMILELSPKTKIYDFNDVLSDISILDKCEFIFTIGGDGSVAWLIETFFDVYNSVSKLKPIVPVIRPKSIGYLKQLDLQSKKFKKGFKNLLMGNFTIQKRTILKTKINKQDFIAVNEIFLHCAPHLGKYDVYIKYNDSHYRSMTSTMADGVMIVTSIGSTGWALSYRGQIVLNEDALEIVFTGGIHSSANFTLQRLPLRVKLELKNSTINEETVRAFEIAMDTSVLNKSNISEKILEVVYGPRIAIDGKIVAFNVSEIEVDSSLTIPFVFLYQETIIDKARKLTKQPSVK